MSVRLHAVLERLSACGEAAALRRVLGVRGVELVAAPRASVELVALRVLLGLGGVQ